MAASKASERSNKQAKGEEKQFTTERSDNDNEQYGSCISDQEGWGIVKNKNRRKRMRHSTGGRSQVENQHENQLNIPKSTDEFKKLNTDDKLVTMFTMLSNVSLTKVEKNITEILNETNSNNTRLKKLEYKSIDLEARSRRLNLLFRGIPESERDENCFELIHNFLRNDLELVDNIIDIQRAHRLGSKKPGNQSPKPIIVCFKNDSDLQLILANAYKLKGKNQLGINRDFPLPIVEARKRLWRDYKTAKANNPPKNVFIAYPAKLIVRGKVVRNEFPDWDEVMYSHENVTFDKYSVKKRDKPPHKNTKPKTIQQQMPESSDSDSDLTQRNANGDDVIEQPDDYSQSMFLLAEHHQKSKMTVSDT